MNKPPIYLSLSLSSANTMQRQVEVRMHESHLEPIVEPPQPMCWGICSKIMNNLVLFLTILGKLVCPIDVSACYCLGKLACRIDVTVLVS
jgi:hypothetical protein